MFFLYLWFKNKELAFAMSLVFCTCTILSVVCSEPAKAGSSS